MSNFIYISGILSWMSGTPLEVVIYLLFFILVWINSIIYSFISFVYQIFLVLASGGEIFSGSAIDGLVSRIYIIIGVIILFLVAYSLLRNLVNPDEAFKGKQSPVKTITNVLISVVLVAFTPTIFDFAFEFQNSLLNYNVIGKIIAGTNTDDSDINQTIRDGGYNMAAGVWQAFIHVNPEGNEEGIPYCSTPNEHETQRKDDTGEECIIIYTDNGTSYNDLWEKAKDGTTFFDMIEIVPRILDDSVTYLILVDIVAGVFVLLVLLSYCLDMALRLVKLAVYELIAPLPILARIIPNEQASKIFTNWLKATISTFVEVFIRIAILYFAVIIISTVGESIGTLFTNGAYAASDTLLFVRSLAQALIIIGIVLFVKQAPEIIKEITGLDGGKYNVFGSALKSMSMIGGAVTTAANMWNDKMDPKDPTTEKSKRQRVFSAAAGFGSAAWRSTWNRDNVKGFGDMRKNASQSAKAAIDAHNRRVAQGSRYRSMNKNWLEGKIYDIKDDIAKWSGASEGKALLEAKIKLYDQAMDYQKKLMDLAASDESVMGYQAELKRLNDNGLEKSVEDSVYLKTYHQKLKDNMIKQYIADNNINENDPQALENAKEYIDNEFKQQLEQGMHSQVDSQFIDNMSVQEKSDFENDYQNNLREERNARIKMYDNLIKMASYKVIHEKVKKGDGRYVAELAGWETFKSQHLDDATIQEMGDFKISEGEFNYLDRVMKTNNPQYINDEFKKMKEGIKDAEGNVVTPLKFLYDNEAAKKAQGNYKKELAKIRVQEEAKKEEKK